MHKLKELTTLLPFVLLYVLVVYWLFPFLGYYTDSYDIVSYLDVARSIAMGRLADSVNGYWSPLISWLLSFFIYLKCDPIFSFRMIQFAAALFSLWFFNNIMQLFSLQRVLKLIMMFSATCILVSLSYQVLSPDLLFVCLSLFYLQLIMRTNIFSENNFGFVWGLAGAFLFFCKSFGMPFFLVHLTASVTWIHLREPIASFRRQLWKQYALAIFVFGIFAGSWMVVLSRHYQSLTISKAAEFNASKEVSPIPGMTMELPILNGQVIRVSNEHSSAWTTPGDYVKTTPLKPSKSNEDFQRAKMSISRNMLSIYFNDFKRQAGSIFLLLMTFFLFAMRKRHVSNESHIVILLLAYLFLYGGYTLILVHDRYVWLNIFLSLLLAAVFVRELLVNRKWAGYAAVTLFLVFVLLQTKKSYKQMVYGTDKAVTTAQFFSDLKNLPAVLHQRYDIYNKQYHMIKSAAGKYGIEGHKLICIDVPEQYPYNFNESALLAYYTKSNYEGMMAAAPAEFFPTNSRGFFVFDKYYFISWSKTLNTSHIMKNKELPFDQLKLFFADPISGLKIYRVEAPAMTE